MMPTLVLLAGPNGAGKTTFIDRVRRRVERGGHGIPEATLRRRFPLSLDYLETVYKPLVDEWEVWASGDGGPELLDWGPK
jgi:predicted ABC-type ATPase